MGVKLVSFGFVGQGRAIMRGPMVSGVINQLLTTAEWYDHIQYYALNSISALEQGIGLCKFFTPCKYILKGK